MAAIGEGVLLLREREREGEEQERGGKGIGKGEREMGKERGGEAERDREMGGLSPLYLSSGYGPPGCYINYLLTTPGHTCTCR